MPDISADAKRLADQRLDDIAAAHERELDRARLQGHKEALEEVERRDTREHFKVINGSIADTVVELRGVKDGMASMEVKISARIAAIEAKQDTKDAVNVALVASGTERGAKKLTRWQMIFAGGAALVTVGSFVLALVAALAK